MAKQSIQLKAEPRSALGSRANKRLRDSGFVPAVVYGHKEAVVPVTLPKKEISTHLAKGAHVFDLTLSGKSEKVLVKDVQFDHLGGEISIIDKRRESGSKAKAVHIIGDVAGKNIFMVDDMITTAGTMTEAVRILRDNGAKDIYIGATHAVFAPPAMERLAKCDFTKIAVTDTIPIGNRCDAIKDRLVVLSVAELLAQAIHRIYHNESVSALFKDDKGGNRD